MSRKENAIKLYEQKFNCAQSVLLSFSDLLNLDKETLLKISSGFGGGMKKGEVCGAVTGALMVLGLLNSPENSNDPEVKAKIGQMVTDFQDEFEKNNSSTICKYLLGGNISFAKDRAEIEAKNLFKQVCPRLIESSVEILEKQLQIKK